MQVKTYSLIHIVIKSSKFKWICINNMIKNVMATNDFLSQFKLKRSIWFNLIHVLLLLIVSGGLGLFLY